MNGHIHACPKCYRRVPCDYPGCDYVEADLTLDDGTLCGPHVICDDCGTPPAPQGTAPAAKRIYGAALTAKRARPGGGQVAAVAHCIRHVSEDAAEALGLAAAREAFPEADGWTEHSAVVCEVPGNWIAEAAPQGTAAPDREVLGRIAWDAWWAMYSMPGEVGDWSMLPDERKEQWCAAADAVARALLATAPQAAAWRAVTETEPPDGVPVLVIYVDDGKVTGAARAGRCGPAWFEDGHRIFPPSHWMPLPSAPTDGAPPAVPREEPAP